jgi:hypothetical protein
LCVSVVTFATAIAHARFETSSTTASIYQHDCALPTIICSARYVAKTVWYANSRIVVGIIVDDTACCIPDHVLVTSDLRLGITSDIPATHGDVKVSQRWPVWYGHLLLSHKLIEPEPRPRMSPLYPDATHTSILSFCICKALENSSMSYK